MDEIVKIIYERIPIMVAGGFRRGTDVFKGLAFGAQAVGIVRPILYGLAANGKDGGRKVLEQMTSELQRTMTMVGVKNPAAVTKDILL
jgi:isopentenyl diphosphate isomerase/L-lactate dehydrogenase-like FMN-dependent dehydrogenase